VAPIQFDAEDAKRAQDAIRDILYLYRELVAYGGISGDHDIGRFDAWEFLDYRGYAIHGDLKLLHEGSAVALLCDLLDEMEQRGGSSERYRDALASGRFDHLPQAKSAIGLGIAGVDELIEASGPVYRDYVIGYLATLVE
jgi:hypothetical protein